MLQEIRKVNQGQNYMVEGRIRNGQKTSNFFYGRSLGGLVLISYGTVVRDFESEAKTKCNFQF